MPSNWPLAPPSALDLMGSRTPSPLPSPAAEERDAAPQVFIDAASSASLPAADRHDRRGPTTSRSGYLSPTSTTPGEGRERSNSFLLPPRAPALHATESSLAPPMSSSPGSWNGSQWTPAASAAELLATKPSMSGYLSSGLDLPTLPQDPSAPVRPQSAVRSKSDASNDTKFSEVSKTDFAPDSDDDKQVPDTSSRRPWWLLSVSDAMGVEKAQTSTRAPTPWRYRHAQTSRRHVDSDKEKVEPGHTRSATASAVRRRRWVLLGAGLLAFVLVVALAAGLGAGLHRKKHTLEPNASSLSTAADLVDDSKAGLQQSGAYRTSYANVSNTLAFNAGEDLTFSSAAPAGGADVVLQVGQGTDVHGFGASLTDASAMVLAQLKRSNPANYAATLRALFNRRSGLSVLRVPIGATDFSTRMYTWADKQAGGVNATPANALANINDEPAAEILYPVLRDILAVNPDVKLMILPWSPPAWMKHWGTLEGGPLADNATNYVVEYLAQSARLFTRSVGVQPWAISIQNEPTNPTSYPSALIEPAQELTLLGMLRGRMAELGMGSTKLVGLEDDTVYYTTALHLLNTNASAVDAISWHCYNGGTDLISTFVTDAKDKMNGKELFFTECSGLADSTATYQDGWVNSSQWWMTQLLMPLMELNFTVALGWNLALDDSFGPRLAGAYCDNCFGTVQVVGRGVYTGAPQHALFAHLALASANLTRFGGGAAHHTPVALASPQAQNCLFAAAFAAPWDHQTKAAARHGLVLHNNCTNLTQINVQDQASGGTQKLDVPFGVSTFVWSK